MKLRVRNFGPIRKADVGIKPLTVFVGPSNTGKSYLAMLLYSVANVLDGGKKRIIMRALYRHFSEEFGDSINNPMDIVKDDGEFLPIVQGAISIFTGTVWDGCGHEGRRCFGAEWSEIARRKSNVASVHVSHNNKIALDLFNSKDIKFADAKKVAKAIRGGIEKSEEREQKGLDIRLPHHYNLEDLCARVLFEFLSYLPEAQDILDTNRVHYLPAARGGIMLSHNKLTEDILEGAAAPSNAPIRSVFVDFLNDLARIGEISGDKKKKGNSSAVAKSDNFARKMEEILHGKIEVKTSKTGYPRFFYQFDSAAATGHEIPLMTASSAVSELAPIALFMQHHLSPGDVFIVEEPESHLHPKAQREVAEILVGLVIAGVHVVVTTHSDIMLEQLSNFVHAHGAPKAQVLGKGSDGRTISPDQVAVYSFADSSLRKGTDVREVKFDDDTGMVTQDHLDEAADIYNEFVGIADAQEDD